jgi:DNA-binding NarL/FixJ family response regulator
MILASNLTAQEKAVLTLLVQGKSNSSIAENLCLSKRTVDNHLYRIFAKLGVSSRVEAVLYVLETGLLSNSNWSGIAQDM